MSKILKLVQKHYSDGSCFDSRDFERKTGIEHKVSAMNLKKLANSCKIGTFSSRGENVFFYRSKEQINEAIKKYNSDIKKYDLKHLKLKEH